MSRNQVAETLQISIRPRNEMGGATSKRDAWQDGWKKIGEKDAVQAGLPPFLSTTIFDLQLTIIDESLQNSSIFEECLRGGLVQFI